MKIKQAIQRAIDNGWRYGGCRVMLLKRADTFPAPVIAVHIYNGIRFGLTAEQVVLDPKFWEALGRAEGWGKYTGEKSTLEDRETWKDKMHRMIDALIAGKSLEEFFKEL